MNRRQPILPTLPPLLAALVLAGTQLPGCGGAAPPSGGDAGSDAGPDGGDAGPAWGAPVTVDSAAGAGLDLVAALDPNGRPAIAYFRQEANTFTPGCSAAYGCPQFALVVARETAPGTWTSEAVPAALDGGSLTGHFGLALAFDTQGNPAVAYLGGDSSDNDPRFPDNRWHDFLTGAPLPSDLVVARKSGAAWTRTTLATGSDSLASDFAVTTSHLDDNGPVVGLWAGLAFDADGSLHAVQRDVHFGSAAGDFDGSNLEYGHFSGATLLAGEIVTSRIYPLSPVSQLVHGGGTYTHLVLAGGQPAVSFSLGLGSATEASQVWFARRTGAAAWTRTQVSDVAGRVGHGPSLAYSASQGFALGIFDATQGDLLVATSADGAAWQVNTVEALGETGWHPAVAWSGATLGLLYGYCHDAVFSGSGCDPLARQLRFRVPGAGGPQGAWSDPEPVDPSVPDATALLADGAGNFVAVWRGTAGGVRSARRSP